MVFDAHNQWILMDVFIGTTLHGYSSPSNSLLKCTEARQGTRRLTNDASDQRQKKKREKA